MWNNFTHQINHFPYLEFERFIRIIRSDESAFPFFLDYVKQFGSVCVLTDRKTRSNFPTEAMSLTGLKRNAKTTFTIYKTGNIRIQIHKQSSGLACYEIWRFHPRVLKPWVVTGNVCYHILTLGITRDKPALSVGLHRFEPVIETESLPLRAVLSTRQGISLP